MVITVRYYIVHEIAIVTREAIQMKKMHQISDSVLSRNIVLAFVFHCDNVSPAKIDALYFLITYK